MKDCSALIPARSGSKGVKEKNIKELLGYPLLCYTITAAKMAGIKQIIVSTDSERYAKIAKGYGAEVPFLRPKSFSEDDSTDYDWINHLIKFYTKKKIYLSEYLFHLRPTSPIRDYKILIDAYNFLKKDKIATSLRSGHQVSESPFKWFLKDENGYFKGLREDITSETVNLPRQKFPKVYNPNGYVDILKLSYLLNNKSLHGDKMIVYETPLLDEVDTMEDFNYIKYKANKSNIAKQLLNNIKKE